MKKLIYLPAIIGMTTLFACGDCMQRVSGTVIDKQTNQPVENVYIEEVKSFNDNNTYTDQKGNFELSRISGGLFSCPPMKVVIMKKGFEAVIIKMANDEHKTITLRKLSKI